MPSFVTYDELLEFKTKLDETVLLKAASVYQSGTTVFLSHSSKDIAYLPSVVLILKNHGASVYIDLGDNRLPEKPSPTTAQVLRDTIQGCKKFVLFVTPNSKDSKWIPWELGLGDGFKGCRNVALFPSAQYSSEQKWSEQEYLGLYQRIVWGQIGEDAKAGWMVYDHTANTATWLKAWLS